MTVTQRNKDTPVLTFPSSCAKTHSPLLTQPAPSVMCGFYPQPYLLCVCSSAWTTMNATAAYLICNDSHTGGRMQMPAVMCLLPTADAWCLPVGEGLRWGGVEGEQEACPQCGHGQGWRPRMWHPPWSIRTPSVVSSGLPVSCC